MRLQSTLCLRPRELCADSSPLLQAALISMRTDLPNAARGYAQSFVFAVVRQDAETQRHLGLQASQSVMYQ